jgi:hypothetical protein
MHGVNRLLYEPDPGKLGPGSEPQLDQIIAPIAAAASEGLEHRSQAARPDRDEAPRVQRAAGLARCEVNDLDRSIEGDARRDIEDEAVGEKRGVERGKRSGGVKRWRFKPWAHQIRPLGDRRRHRAEPYARRQPVERGELGREAPVDEH